MVHLGALLPAAAFVCLFAVLRSRSGSADPRLTFLHASAGIGLAVVVITEGLSLIGALTGPFVTGAWTLATLGIAAALVRGPRARLLGTLPRRWTLSWMAVAMGAITALIVTVTGVVAIAATPNTWDSMTYHLSRVMHWAQNGTVSFYPTNIERQLHPPPFAEYAALQALLLSGGDHWFNLVQWLSMVGALVGVSLVARQLGASGKGQVAASLVAATLPMGIVQSSSTQNDYVLAFWMVGMAAATLVFTERPTISNGLVAGTFLGLALLTKGTAYVFAAPLTAMGLALGLRSMGHMPPRALVASLAAAGIALLLNLGHYQRNLDLYGSILGPGFEDGPGFFARYTNDAMNVPLAVSNLARNVTLHLSTPWKSANDWVLNGAIGIHDRLGIAADDARTTWPGEKFTVPIAATDDERTGNPVHFVMIVGSLMAVPLIRDIPRRHRALAYVLALGGAFLLFAVVLRWQPWHSRLHLPWFLLGAPLVGLLLDRSRSVVLIVVLAFMLGWSWPALVSAEARPLVGRSSVLTTPPTDQMFRGRRRDYRNAVMSAVETIQTMECRRIGLLFEGSDWEYPFWYLLSPDSPEWRIDHVGVVARLSGRLASPRWDGQPPCAIIAFQPPPTDPFLVGSEEYRPLRQMAPITIYASRSRAA